uniref:Synaptonemal complex protein 1 n=1 Tax=Sinocyclocheilus rhinocerous TaxID=307959 RepID=A0A673JIY1_9TELE
HSMQKPFNFKLLVPPRAHLSQVSAVKPQETGLFEENSLFSPSNQVGKLVNSLLTSVRSSQLYSRLLDEAEKIKLWKFKIDSEISQKDRKLQENRKTIETQRKAIQELQFANEGLSMKLEDQLNENEDLRNTNATRNLCNILKDTFERSAEKMNLFEAEREETHDLFLQNNENIQRMVAAFEALRKQAEADQQDMLKCVAMLQEELQEKENNLKDVSLKLKEAQQSSSVIEESASKNCLTYFLQIIKLKEDSESIEKCHKEELQKISSDLEDKSTSEAQLNLEVQKLKQTAMEALKSKDDTEIKCQQKISDMVALMERHKHEYDKMLEEKDAELSEKRMREAEVSASKLALYRYCGTSEKFDQKISDMVALMERHKHEYDKMVEEKDAELSEKRMREAEVSASKGTVNKDLHTPLWSKTTKTTPQIKVWGQPELFALFIIHLEHLYEPVCFPLQSFRIRTPPTPEITGSWKENILKLDPKSDNSDSNDILVNLIYLHTIGIVLYTNSFSVICIFNCSHSFPCKSPGTVLKLAAIKRMRDAGWTTVSNSDKKKKKVTDKIFA